MHYKGPPRLSQSGEFLAQPSGEGANKTAVPCFLALRGWFCTSAVCSHNVMIPAMSPSIVKMWEVHLIQTISKVLKFVTGFPFSLAKSQGYK